MATLNDLFGGGDKPKRPKPPTFNAVGDAFVGVITEEPYQEQMVDLGGSFKKKFFVKGTDGKWGVKLEGEFDTSQEHNKMMQIIVPVKSVENDEDYTLYFGSKFEREALKSAMEASGVPLVPGNAIHKEWTGKSGKAHTWLVKLAAAQ